MVLRFVVVACNLVTTLANNFNMYYIASMDAVPEIISTDDLVETGMLGLQKGLVGGANEAFKENDFEKRNTKMVETVSRISSDLASKSLHLDQEREAKLKNVFRKATEKAGSACSGVSSEKDLKDSLRQAGPIAREFVDEALTAAGIDCPEAQNLIDTVSFNNVMQVVQRQLRESGIDVPDNMLDSSESSIKAGLKKTAEGDWFFDNIDELPFDTGTTLDEDQEKALDVAIRLGNATWMQTQIHRSKFYNDTKFIDPEQREVFNPLDLLKKTQYQRCIDQGYSKEDALARVSFEVYKDILELRRKE